MSETPLNPGIEQVIRESLAETKSWEWEDEDRKWSACGAALKYLQANSTMSLHLAQGVSMKIVEAMMREEEPTLRECPYCRGHHPAQHVQMCPLNPCKG